MIIRLLLFSEKPDESSMAGDEKYLLIFVSSPLPWLRLCSLWLLVNVVDGTDRFYRRVRCGSYREVQTEVDGRFFLATPAYRTYQLV